MCRSQRATEADNYEQKPGQAGISAGDVRAIPSANWPAIRPQEEEIYLFTSLYPVQTTFSRLLFSKSL